MQVNSILQGVLFCCLLLIASYVDIKKRIIPDTICILLFLTGLMNFSPVNLFGILAALPLLIAAVWKENSIGGGDIKLTASVGTVIGFWSGMCGLILGLSAILCYYFIQNLIKKLRKEQVANNASMPLAPFLSSGFLGVYFMNVGGI